MDHVTSSSPAPTLRLSGLCPAPIGTAHRVRRQPMRARGQNAGGFQGNPGGRRGRRLPSNREMLSGQVEW